MASGAYALPPDVLQLVDDFAPCARLGAVCQRWWALLGHGCFHFHVQYHNAAERLAEFAEHPGLPRARSLILHASHLYGASPGMMQELESALQRCGMLRFLTLDVPHCGLSTEGCRQLLRGSLPRPLEALHLDLSGNFSLQTGMVEWLAELLLPLRSLSLSFAKTGASEAPAVLGLVRALRPACSLRTVALRFGHRGLDAAGVMQLAGLGRLTQLDSLTLALPHCLLTVESCWALAELRHSRSLRCLRLELRHSRIGPEAAEALAALKELPGLRELELFLPESGLGPMSAAALSRLANSTTLERLTLDLSSNDLRSAGVEALARLAKAPQMRRLTLLLANNNVDDLGARALATLKDASRLQRLTIDLSGNPIGVGGRTLALLAEAKQLGSLHLNLTRCHLRDYEAVAFGALGALQQLQTLELHLGGNCLTYRTAEALACLRLAPRLSALTLVLNKSNVGDRGAAALAALSSIPTLERLTLGLEDCSLGPDAGTALASLQQATALRRLHLWLRLNRLGEGGVNEVTRVAAAPQLCHLALDVVHNVVSATALTRLLDATRLQSLALVLNPGDTPSPEAKAVLSALSQRPGVDLNCSRLDG